ncbi:MAG: DUF427 domain-containing protein [Alphaproteobacteria bacterium]|nr:DUF427 domain-containing protein [Alphaproteobacteria bacterium]
MPWRRNPVGAARIKSVRLKIQTETLPTCPWRGVASYFTVRVGETEIVDAAFSYETPKKRARRIAGWIGFWKGVEVEDAEE